MHTYNTPQKKKNQKKSAILHYLPHNIQLAFLKGKQIDRQMLQTNGAEDVQVCACISVVIIHNCVL